MRTAVVATLAGGALILGSGSAASAAPVPINIKIPNTVVVEETTANFNLAVPLKVTCDPSFGTISFNVLVNQGSVGGFAFVSSVTCTGKTVNVAAHPSRTSAASSPQEGPE